MEGNRWKWLSPSSLLHSNLVHVSRVVSLDWTLALREEGWKDMQRIERRLIQLYLLTLLSTLFLLFFLWLKKDFFVSSSPSFIVVIASCSAGSESMFVESHSLYFLLQETGMLLPSGGCSLESGRQLPLRESESPYKCDEYWLSYHCIQRRRKSLTQESKQSRWNKTGRKQLNHVCLVQSYMR